MTLSRIPDMPTPTTPNDPITLALDEASSQVDIRGCRVLVVDDNQQNTELVQAYLESLPVEIARWHVAPFAARIVSMVGDRSDTLVGEVAHPPPPRSGR